MASSGEITGVRQMLASLPDTKTMELAQLRAVYDQFGLAVPVADGVSIEPATGVAGVWARPDGAPTDAALLYLHGGGYLIGSTERLNSMHPTCEPAIVARTCFFVTQVLAADTAIGSTDAGLV